MGTLGGILPDIDSDTSIPVQLLFEAIGILIPIVIIKNYFISELDIENMIFLMVLGYIIVHLLMDEIWSVDLTNIRIKNSFGTALTLRSNSIIVTSIFIGLLSGISPTAVINAVQSGMANTLGSIAVIIGLGSIFGAILEKSGGAEEIAYTLIKKFGDNNTAWALVITGFIVGITVFNESLDLMDHKKGEAWHKRPTFSMTITIALVPLVLIVLNTLSNILGFNQNYLSNKKTP